MEAKNRSHHALVCTFDVDSNGQRNVLLPNGTQQSAKVNDPINAVVNNHFLKAFKVQDIGKNIRSFEDIARFRIGSLLFKIYDV